LRLLTVAAVAGREFELAVVAQAADTSIDRAIDLFDEALSAAIVDEIDNRPDRLRFAHILIRVTLYEEASHARRFRLHRRVGEAIEEFHASDLSPWIADLAGHFIACAADGDATKGVRYAIEAGQQAMEQVAYGEAVNYFLQAVELVGDDANRGDGNEQYVELLLLLANALRCDGETQQARETYSRAAMIASDAGQADLLARAALGIADTEGEASVDDDTSIRYLEQALALLPDSASVLRASALACLSMVLQYHGPDTMPRRGELARRAVELARHAGDPATLATALRAQLMAEWDPLDLTTSLKITEEILQLAREAGAGGLALIMHSQRFSHFMELGDVASADRELEAYATLAEELRLPYNRWSVTLKQSMRALMEGRFDDGQRLAYEAYQIGERSAPNSAHPLYVVQQFPLYRERGGLETIEADLRRYAEEDYISVTFERCLIAMIYCEMGRDDDARSELARIAQGRFGEIPVNIFWLGVTALLAEISAHLGETERCRDLYHQLMPFSGRLANSGTGVISIGPVSYFLGILATALGNLDDAEQHLHQAIELSERINAAPFAIRARLALADVLATRGTPADQDRLSGLLEQCQASARQLGMTRLYEHANSRLLSRR
jgi:tetratricopeptide (TPR) repeat protein